MKATTIKIEGDLLDNLEENKPQDLSLSAFVRLLLYKGLRKQKLTLAGAEYVKFLSSNKEEVEFLKEWEESDLVNNPKEKKQK